MASDDPRLGLPASLACDLRHPIARLTLDRAAKRNALDDETVLGIERFFDALDDSTRVVVLDAVGDHFSAGLDLSALGATTTFEGVLHSRMWHRVFEKIESGGVPVISVLRGAVVGGGLELAAATHIRVAEPSTFYALPEGRRGLFVGGGASVRVSRLIGAHRVADMMLTGRVVSAEEGQALGLSHYLVPAGGGVAHALELAASVAENSPITNYAVVSALPRIVASNPTEGLMIEALMAAVSSGSDEAKRLMREFLDGTGPRVRAVDRHDARDEREQSS